jgi:hypothetical protein
VTVETNSCAFYHAHERVHWAPGLPCALVSEGQTIRLNPAQTCCEIAELCLRMTLLKIDSVGWANGALAPCPPSVDSLTLNGGQASTFALRATADALPTLRIDRHHPRKRMIQYPRGIGDGIERSRRTGYPAFAGYDDLLWS